ncbi:glycosyltransferase family 2 protein [Microvirga lotononidis]|uniref:Glycosyl transferase n=1 Tax=Microvirga lotononidis TaxID=864069 RepID=I4Z185_9HYPH|nr:cellulose synthase catalytic subunit [Microvirga lotononidis]EIM29977.1 glycosyl transferase [Microvirga lotononidis]WQO31968.1 glycosyltransferase [Microvirga lotononidis]
MTLVLEHEPRSEGLSPLPPVGPGKAAATEEQPLLVPLFTGYRKAGYWMLAAIWLATLVYFWEWWLRPEHNIGTIRYTVTTLTLAWLTLLPLYFVFIFLNGRMPNAARPAPRDHRVAMVVTKAPSEPFPIVKETLEAMLRQTYPHDAWLADEDPTPETIAWCAAHGVRISTRKGRNDYHRVTWPRRTRCKEGNLAFFYDHFGYENYDFVAQLDADHVPDETYLEEMLRPFGDPHVGYVSAPSICDRNASGSWSARGRLYVEAMLHGALQAGYNGGLAPLCIGSHYAVRTKALKEIGGLGPELAEDHSTTLFMNAYGWRGVHAVNAIAHGDGPQTFADMVTQEFQWSRSLMMILLEYTPGLLHGMPWRLKLQFLFCQLWYPLFSLVMPLMFVMPIVALVLDANIVGVTYPEFMLHFGVGTLALVLIVATLARSGWGRPADGKVLSWEGTLFLFARWPWSLLGTAAAVRDWWTGTIVEFRVTPKGTAETPPLPTRVVLPYALLSLASGLPALLLDHRESSAGFYVFTIVNCVLYAILTVTILVRHCTENGILRPGDSIAIGRANCVPAMVIAAMILVPCLAMPRRIPQGLAGITFGIEKALEQIPGRTWLATDTPRAQHLALKEIRS